MFYNKFISCLYLVRAPCTHHQEVKIVLHSLWYHHTCRRPSGAQVERVLSQPVQFTNMAVGRIIQPARACMVPESPRVGYPWLKVTAFALLTSHVRNETSSGQKCTFCLCFSVSLFYLVITSQCVFISVIDQIDAQNFCFTVCLFHASTCFEHHVLETCRGMK